MASSSIVRVQNISSDSSSEEESQENSTARRRRGKCIYYEREKSFYSGKEIEEFLASEDTWAKSHAQHTKEGFKQYYYCTQNKACKACLYVLYVENCDEVVLFRSDIVHDHSKEQSKRGISRLVKEEINKLYQSGVKKPKFIQLQLAKKGLNVTDIQLNNYLQTLRNPKGPSTISLGEMMSWCKKYEHKEPLDSVEFDVGLVFYEINDDDDEEKSYFRLFFTTKRLLSCALKRGLFVQADATYKLNYNGFPVFVVGNSDFAKRFHPFGIAVCVNQKASDFAFIFQTLKDLIERIFGDPYNPVALVADENDEIWNGFTAVFGDYEKKRITCWPHAYRKLLQKLNYLIDRNENLKECIINDLNSLHLSKSEVYFDKAVELFLDKWRLKSATMSIDSINTFLDYFQEEWLGIHKGWFVSLCDYLPSDNNGIESKINSMKDNFAFRERMPLARFLPLMKEIVERWSIECMHKQFQMIPQLDVPLWTTTHQYKQSKPVIFKLADETYYFVASNAATEAQNQHYLETCLNLLKSECDDLDTFVNAQFSYWSVSVSQHVNEHNYSEANMIKCDCPRYKNDHVCEHSLYIAIYLKLCEIPNETKLGQKRKNEETLSKSKKALIVQ